MVDAAERKTKEAIASKESIPATAAKTNRLRRIFNFLFMFLSLRKEGFRVSVL
jgi:hypothetical protein